MNEKEEEKIIRKMIQAGISAKDAEEYLKDPRQALASQQTAVLILMKDKIIALDKVVAMLNQNIMDLQKQVAELNAWKWRTEGK